jgi:hypothetical protein
VASQFIVEIANDWTVKNADRIPEHRARDPTKLGHRYRLLLLAQKRTLPSVFYCRFTCIARSAKVMLTHCEAGRRFTDVQIRLT